MKKILLLSATKLEHHDDDLYGIPIHIIGVGKVDAALNTYKLIKKYSPDHVINFGSCGDLKSHRAGEVFEIGSIYDDFYGCVVPEHDPIEISNSPHKLFTTDTFYDKFATYSNAYHQNVNRCDFVDMEGYSIAKVCKAENISLSLYKWVSDDGSPRDWRENAANGYNNFKQVFKEWLEQQK